MNFKEFIFKDRSLKYELITLLILVFLLSISLLISLIEDGLYFAILDTLPYFLSTLIVVFAYYILFAIVRFLLIFVLIKIERKMLFMLLLSVMEILRFYFISTIIYFQAILAIDIPYNNYVHYSLSLIIGILLAWTYAKKLKP